MAYVAKVYRIGIGYGYRIMANGKRVIDQPHKPAVPGVVSMTLPEAEIIAGLVIAKLRAGKGPGLTVEEVETA